MKYISSFCNVVLALSLTLLASCNSAPTKRTAFQHIDLDSHYANNVLGNRITKVALGQIGTRYRFGGNTPRGFDCSGLVYYSYGKLGIQVPRSSVLQSRAIRRVSRSRLKPGDLVFFTIYKNQVSHVGIYYHNGYFIHAPKSGKRVSFASMDNPYWQKHYHSAGRIKVDPQFASRDR